MQDDFSPVTPSSFPNYTSGPKTNSLSTTSLILSLAGLVLLCPSMIFGVFCACPAGLSAVAAVVTGFMARNQIQISGEKGDGNALAGMVIGGIQVAMLLCLAVGYLLILLVLALGEILSSISSSLK